MGHNRRRSIWDGWGENPGEDRYRQRGGGWGENPWQGWMGAGWGGPGHGGPGGPGGRGGRGGPPPWVQGLLGWGAGPEPQRPGPRVRRGDVRIAILDVLRVAAERQEPVNGYQVIQQIADQSGGAWRPSPGSVYPTIQQLQDEGLVESDDDHGRKTVRLTAAGTAYAADHAEELAAVWAPFQPGERAGREVKENADVKAEIGQVMSAVWQIVSQGSPAQRAALVDVLVETRRSLYGILADGADQRPPARPADEATDGDETDDETGEDYPGGPRP